MTDTPADHPVPPPTGEDLHVVAEYVPPASEANDSIVLASAVVAGLGGLAFGVGLLLRAPLEVYGSALAVGLFALGVGVRRFMIDRFADVEALEARPAPVDVREPLAGVAPLPRRRLLGRVLAAGGALLGVGLLAPVVSLGPLPGGTLGRTRWEQGKRLVTTDGVPVRPEQLAPGSVVTVWPEDAILSESSATVLLRLTGGEARPPTVLGWVVDEQVIAYSKICTHAGCPVALFRERDDALFCPCHQSTFDVRHGAIPVFGPAARALPQLPMGVDEEGFLVALDDYREQIGPAFG